MHTAIWQNNWTLIVIQANTLSMYKFRFVKFFSRSIPRGTRVIRVRNISGIAPIFSPKNLLKIKLPNTNKTRTRPNDLFQLLLLPGFSKNLKL